MQNKRVLAAEYCHTSDYISCRGYSSSFRKIALLKGIFAVHFYKYRDTRMSFLLIQLIKCSQNKVKNIYKFKSAL
jgi:hypothetical protein